MAGGSFPWQQEGIQIEQRQQEFFVKVRVLPTEIILGKLNINPTGTAQKFTDTFFDTPQFSLGKENEYLRQRQSASGFELVKQSCYSNDQGLLIHNEEIVSDSECEDKVKILTYSFQRRQSIIEVTNGQILSYLDTIDEPCPYEILSISKKVIVDIQVIDFSNEVLNALKIILVNVSELFSAVNDLKHLHSSLSMIPEYLPIRTKFMTMLQLSHNAFAYEDVYEQHDCAKNYGQHILTLGRSSQSFEVAQLVKKYYWFTEGRPDLFDARFLGSLHYDRLSYLPANFFEDKKEEISRVYATIKDHFNYMCKREAWRVCVDDDDDDYF